MSGLLIRVDHQEKVLRSVGEPPNGIVCLVAPAEGAAWAIDAAWQPPQIDALPGGGVVLELQTGNGVGEASTIVDAEDIVAGCASHVEARGLLEMVCASVFGATQRFIPVLQFEIVAGHIALAQETRDALERHGYLVRPTDG